MSEQKTQQKLQTFRGKIENVESKNTRSGLSMVVFAVNGYPFKAFGSQAEAVQKLRGHHAEIKARHNTYKGKDEYAVVTIAGEIGGHPVAVTDTSKPVPPSLVPQQKLEHSDRHQWNLRSYGSDIKAREVGIWLNQFFDNLTEDEWKQWKEYPNSHWPIHDSDRQAERDQNEKYVREFKEDFERRNGKPYKGTDADIVCSSPVRAMPQDLGGVNARFYARLDEVRGDLKHEATAAALRSPTTTMPAEPPPPEEKLSMQSAI